MKVLGNVQLASNIKMSDTFSFVWSEVVIEEEEEWGLWCVDVLSLVPIDEGDSSANGASLTLLSHNVVESILHASGDCNEELSDPNKVDSTLSITLETVIFEQWVSELSSRRSSSSSITIILLSNSSCILINFIFHPMISSHFSDNCFSYSETLVTKTRPNSAFSSTIIVS